MLPRYKFGILLLLLIVVNVGAGLVTRDSATLTGWVLVPWVTTIALVAGCFAIIGQLPPNPDWRGVLVDQRNKISLSRLQLVAWTVLVISSVICEGVINAAWGRATPLTLSIPPELWILLGISTTSFVAAPMVLGTKGTTLDTKPENHHAWRDLFYGDDTGNADQVDFSKVQQFLFTVVLVAVYAVGIGSVLASAVPSSSLLHFPRLDPGFIGIMAVSQTAYIAYKAVPQNRTDATQVKSQT